MSQLPVTYDDVLAALPRVRSVLRPTALYEWPGLCERLGFQFLLKHENHQPVGAFKVRGGISLVGTLSEEERAAGVLACSTGNHGQSLAFACRHFGVRCTIVVPRGNNPDKNAAIRRLGAELIEEGRDFDEAREYLDQVLAPRGGRYVHSANEPMLIAGVGTMACEIFDDCGVFDGNAPGWGHDAPSDAGERAIHPADQSPAGRAAITGGYSLGRVDARPRFGPPDVIIVPIGLGSGVCGTCLVAKARRPQTEVIGVQAAKAPAVARSWQSGTPERTDSAGTWAEGIATRVPAEMTLEIMRALMDDVLLVDEDELRRACRWLLSDTHNLAEGAGAAALAAAYKHRERFRGKRVVGILSGGNLDLKELPRILGAEPA